MKAAALVYLAGIWVAVTLWIVFNGGIHSVVCVYYIALPVAAAWLLGLRAAMASTILCVGSLFLVASFERPLGLVPQDFSGLSLGIWTVLAMATIFSALPVARVLQFQQSALIQSRSAQDALDRYQGRLEEMVQERTSELVGARDQAQAASRAKSLFVANMSHELSTPLHAILGFSTLLCDEPNLSEEQREHLYIISHCGEQLLQLIDGVIDVAKIDAGRLALDNVPLDLEALLRDTSELMRGRIQERRLKLMFETSPAVPRYVQSDPGKLHQILVSLIGNAIKFTGDGAVAVRVDAIPGEGAASMMLKIEVASTIGGSSEDQPRLFDPFTPAGNLGFERGTSPGLTISRELVAMMGGSIRLENTPGVGSVFQLQLPVQRADGAEIVSAGAEDSPVLWLASNQPEYRILIVENEKVHWMLLQRILQNCGFRVRVAQTGGQGIQAFTLWQPHFIWMDMHLPDMEGVRVAREIRTREGGQKVKIVGFTTSAPGDEREEARAAAFDGFLRKPFRSRQIFECLETQLDVRYIYKYKEPVRQTHSRSSLRAEALASIPAELRNDLASALVSLDVERITESIRGISRQDAVVGEILRSGAEQYAFTSILRAVTACEAQTSKENS